MKYLSLVVISVPLQISCCSPPGTIGVGLPDACDNPVVSGAHPFEIVMRIVSSPILITPWTYIIPGNNSDVRTERVG